MTQERRYFIGTSGWNYAHWKVLFYPAGLSQKRWFGFYAKKFDTVEINYSFYRWPQEKTLLKWYNEAPTNFQFTMKVPKTITHIRKFHEVGEKVQEFYKLTDLLQEKAACYLFQAPPSMQFTEKNFVKLEQFCKTLDKARKNVIEFRDESWWNEEVYDLLKKYQVIFCITSGLGMPNDIIVTTKIAYFRFHGESYATEYSKKELEYYAEIMQKLACEQVYAYFNNDPNAYATYNAAELQRLLQIK